MARAPFSELYNTWQRDRVAARPRPAHVIAFMTYRCTNRCATCKIWQRAEGAVDAHKAMELDVAEWERIIEKLSRAKIHSVEVFGGDALLLKDIVCSLVQKCTDLGMETFFPTNCNLLDEQTALRLVGAGLGTVYFSVDGLEGLQNSIRGNVKAHTNTTQAIRNIHEARRKLGKTIPRMGMLTTVSKMNIDQVENLLYEFKKYPVDFVYPRAMGEVTEEDAAVSQVDGIVATPFFTSTSGASNLLSEKQAEQFEALLIKWHRQRQSWPFHIGLAQPLALDKEAYTKGIYPDYPCHIMTTVPTLTPSGEVVPCPFFTDYVLGDLSRESDLEMVWGNEKHMAFIKKQRNGELAVCRKCSMRHFYPGVKERIHQVVSPYCKRFTASRRKTD